MKKNTLRHSLLLLLTAAIWGFAFVAQSVGMDYVQPFTFTAARSLIGGIVLLPFIFIRAQKRYSPHTASATEIHKRIPVFL